MNGLVLFPRQQDYSPASWDAVITNLTEAGVIQSQALPQSSHQYSVGDNFLDYVTFLGCSPAIELEKNGSGSFCFFEFKQFESTPCLFRLQHGVEARCPACRGKINAAAKILDDWQIKSTPTVYECALCNVNSNVNELNWRHTAGFASCGIVIHNIYAHEALPVDGLMLLLTQASQIDWVYCYANTLVCRGS